MTTLAGGPDADKIYFLIFSVCLSHFYSFYLKKKKFRKGGALGALCTKRTPSVLKGHPLVSSGCYTS